MVLLSSDTVCINYPQYWWATEYLNPGLGSIETQVGCDKFYPPASEASWEVANLS